MTTSAERRKRLQSAFSQFRDALADILTDEAQRSVREAIDRLGHEVNEIDLRNVEVEVVIHNLEVASVPGSSSPQRTRSSRSATSARPRAAKSSPRRRRAKAPESRGTGRKGRPGGPVRTALLETFAQAGDRTMTTSDVRDALRTNDVQTSDDNLHQQLRRLVQNGAIERAGRGLYRAASAQPDD